MKNKKTILVSGASGIVGYGILRSLKNQGYNLIGTTIYFESVASYFSDVFELAPHTSDGNYIEWLVGIIEKYKVDMIIPAIEADLFKWQEFREVLESTGSCVLLNDSNLIKLCSDKWLFYKELEKHSSPYVIKSSLEYLNEDFPLLLKPRRGYASQGIVIVNNRDEVLRYKSEIGNRFIVQPVIGSKEFEYTTSAFFDKNSNLCAHMTLQRKLSKEGFTEFAQTAQVDGVKEMLVDLAKIFNPIGPTNFQFRLHNGQIKLLEINPRISSATSIRVAFGYNESLMSAEYFLEGKIPCQPTIKKGKAARYVEDVISYDSSDI